MGPQSFAYACKGGASLSVVKTADSVSVTDPEGDVIDLPASPPGQSSRYGKDAYALLVGNHDALWMKAGKAPVSCKR